MQRGCAAVMRCGQTAPRLRILLTLACHPLAAATGLCCCLALWTHRNLPAPPTCPPPATLHVYTSAMRCEQVELSLPCSHPACHPFPPQQVCAAALCGGQAVAAAAAGDRAHAACVGGPQMTQCDLLTILKVRGASKENMGIEEVRGENPQGSLSGSTWGQAHRWQAGEMGVAALWGSGFSR